MIRIALFLVLVVGVSVLIYQRCNSPGSTIGRITNHFGSSETSTPPPSSPGASPGNEEPSSFLVYVPRNPDGYKVPKSLVELFQLEFMPGANRVVGYAPTSKHKEVLALLALVDFTPPPVVPVGLASAKLEESEPVQGQEVAPKLGSENLVVKENLTIPPPPLPDTALDNNPERLLSNAPLELKTTPKRSFLVSFVHATAELKKADSFSLDWLLEVGASRFASPRIRGDSGSLTLSTPLFSAALTGAVERGVVVVRSRPFLQLQEGSRGVLNSGSKVPVASSNLVNQTVQNNVTFQDVGFDLEVTIDDGLLTVTQKNSSVLNTLILAGNSVPVIGTSGFSTSINFELNTWHSLGSFGSVSNQKTGKIFAGLAIGRNTHRTESILCCRVSDLTSGLQELQTQDPDGEYFERMPSVYVRPL